MNTIQETTTKQLEQICMLVSQNKAHQLTGKARTTIARHVKDGKLSSENGQIETSELIRVYGPLIKAGAASNATTSNNNETASKIALLELQLRHSEELLDLANEKAEREAIRADRAEAQYDQLLLEQQPEKPKASELFNEGVQHYKAQNLILAYTAWSAAADLGHATASKNKAVLEKKLNTKT